MIFVTFLLSVLFTKSLAFYQDEYRVIHERAEIVRYNHSYIANITFALAFVNRTTRAAYNFHGYLLADAGMNVKAVAQFYKFLSNEYRYFPATIPVNLCTDLLQNKMFGLDDIKQFSNVELCPFKKGWYHINNYVPDYTKYPPHIPFGRYKLETIISHSSDFVMEIHWYGKVEEIIKWQ